uniref:Spermatogenesis-associated protein 20-like TRX domain-containing protein n=1 Tax=Candidatus Kentrum sp. DK TaxID=2126562 RepID=A0A450RW57_9GAMM|nr:MAG: hypothetical protein BECKDK2373B_GA0170837_10053 [Candidatus Kentron sp. DK]
MTQPRKQNALAGETSPYLLQHATGPVDWHPWGKAALEKARREDKPILLSVGYSTCHWCHVMAHESFQDEHTADLMNRHFINIKVDREERPDLDKIYQMAHQLITRRHGGWPLTMFLAPDDLTPFFGGTYFPDQARHGMPSFSEILTGVAETYRKQREDIGHQNRELREMIGVLGSVETSDDPITETPLAAVNARLWEEFDWENGGLGQAPKFPHPTSLDYLLRLHASRAAGADDKTGDDETGKQASMMTAFTLARMADGGIFDQIGGGFFRYSVDERWRIPHFEKMLYDNALLLGLYTDSWQATGNPFFQRIALEVGDWVIREMQSIEGGYYSALDADSAGEDGKLREGEFYVWTPEEARQLLTEAEYRFARLRFGLDLPANFEDKWHLFVAADAERLFGELESDGDKAGEELGALLSSARKKLFQARKKRAHPARDEKILTAWNALMITGMARAGRVLKEDSFVHSAERALAFLRENLWRDGRLLATGKDGHAHLPAYLDDYVFLMDALLELLQCRWRNEDLEFARELAEVVLARFQDREKGGFYFTADDHEALLHRPKPMMDEATPSGNGIAARVFTRLGHLLGEARYLEAAERTLRAGWRAMNDFPQSHTTLLSGVREYLMPPQIIVLRGDGEPLARWRERCQRTYAPERLVFAIPSGTDGLPAALGVREARGDGKDGTVAYGCEGYRCQAPVTDFEALEKML